MIQIIGQTKRKHLHTVHGYELSNQGQGNGNTKRLVHQVSYSNRHHISSACEAGIHKHPSHITDSKFPASRTHTQGVLTIAPLLGLPGSVVSLSDASEDWVNAVQDALDHILLVISNNPGRDMAEIVQRVDIQQALHEAGRESSAAVIADIKQDWSDAGAPMNSAYLASVIRDMIRNGATFPTRMTLALSQGSPEDAQRILLTDRLRAAAAQASAHTRAITEANIAQMKKDGVIKVRWKAHIDKNTCSSCLALNGQVQYIGLEFDTRILTSNGLRVYGNLIGPPAHPNCRCELVPA